MGRLRKDDEPWLTPEESVFWAGNRQRTYSRGFFYINEVPYEMDIVRTFDYSAGEIKWTVRYGCRWDSYRTYKVLRRFREDKLEEAMRFAESMFYLYGGEISES